MGRFRLLALAAAALAVAVPALAQGTGTLQGQVNDEQGLALPGATVSAANAATGLQRSTTSDASGVFRIPGLPVGTYEIKVTLTGFAEQTRREAVNVAATTSVN